MCERQDSGAFTWGMTISVHSCVRGRIWVHSPDVWRFAVHSCVRGTILVYLPEEWRFRYIHVWVVGCWCIYWRHDDLRCIHVWGLRFRCIYLRSDDVDAFMCEGFRGLGFRVAITWEMMISVHSCVRGKIPVHSLEGWWCRCIHVWGVGYRCIYLRSDDMRCIHAWGVRFRCIYLRIDDVWAFMCEG